MQPTFNITANNADVTSAIASRLISLRITDESGMTSDTLEIVVADDPLNPVALPPTGAELRPALGYGSALQGMGLFVADEVELQGWPATLTIRGRAGVLADSTQGKTSLLNQKTRSWPNQTTFGALCAKVAKEHGLALSISAALQTIKLPHIDQHNESDSNLLARLCKIYDAIFKPSGGTLVVVRRGESLSGSGQALPHITLARSQISSYSMQLSRRDGPGTVEAFWHSTSQSRRQYITVGSGNPVRRLRHSYKDKASALSAANASLAQRERGQQQLSITCPGRTDLCADALLTVQGVRPGVDGDWLIKSVVHSYSGAGYVCELHCELPGMSDGNDSALAEEAGS